jgi:glycosyltransferase involved in cell wall biosynthesis
MFSILILTRNEENNILDCIQSVAWCDDIVVLDSFSTDQTGSLAEKAGARVFQRAFDDFGSQRNYALDQISFRHPWVFHLDADERFNEALRQECERVMKENINSAFFVPNRIIFLGRWIRHATQYPYPQVRFLKIGEVRFVQAGHGQREDRALRGLGHIHIPYDHYNFSKGLSDWVGKHNQYSTQEAQSIVQADESSASATDLFSSDGMMRRRAMKKIHARLPLRWVVKFFYLYVVKLGFLDRYPGLAYCLLQGFYDFLITVKIKELRMKKP